MPVEKKKVIATKKSLKKPKKSMKRAVSRKISKRTISEEITKNSKSGRRPSRPTRRSSPSPDRMRKYQSAYDSALKKAVESKSRRVRVKDSDKVESKRIVRKKSVSKVSKSIRQSAAAPRAKSEYQLFVQKSMQLPELKSKPVSERMSAIAAMWRNRK